MYNTYVVLKDVSHWQVAKVPKIVLILSETVPRVANLCAYRTPLHRLASRASSHHLRPMPSCVGGCGLLAA